MKNIYYSIAIICIAALITNCDDLLDSWTTKTEAISLPDTNTIAFMAKDGTLCISNTDYKKYYRVTFHYASEQVWSPDKQWICFMYDFKIWKIKYNGTDKIQLTPSTMTCEAPRFSPDGSHIIFVANRYKPHEFITDIYIMDSNGSKLERLTENALISPKEEYYFSWPDWLQNGEKIIFKFAKREDHPSLVKGHLAILDLATRNLTTLSSLDSLDPSQPHPSPTRDEFIFVSLLSRTYGGTDIYRANFDGTGIIRLTQNGGSWLPDWSFDGEQIIYNYLNDNGIHTMRIMNRDGTNDRQLIIAGEEFGLGPNW